MAQNAIVLSGFQVTFQRGNSTLDKFIKNANLNVSILGSLLFILYVNNLCKVSNVLETIMFEDDTNLFFSRQSLFHTANSQRNKILAWLNANILSLNKNRTKYTLFHKAQQK